LIANQCFQCPTAFFSLLKYYNYYLTDDKKPAVRWMKHEKLDGITLIHQKVWYSYFNFFFYSLNLITWFLCLLVYFLFRPCQMWSGITREITSPQLCQLISFMNHVLLILFYFHLFWFPFSFQVWHLTTCRYVHMHGHIEYPGPMIP